VQSTFLRSDLSIVAILSYEACIYSIITRSCFDCVLFDGLCVCVCRLSVTHTWKLEKGASLSYSNINLRAYLTDLHRPWPNATSVPKTDAKAVQLRS